MKNEAIPRLRFRRFTSKWVIKLLNEFSTRIISKNAKNIYKITFTDSAKYGIIIQTNFFYKHISNSKHISNYYIVKPNDYIYNPRKSNYAPYGPIRRNKLGKTGIVSPLYYVFTTHNMDLYFLDNYFVSNKWYKYIYSHGNTGARADRVSIKIKDLKMMPVYIPSLPEQQLIGKLFAKLDKLIQLQQKKVSLLKKLKRGYLQKLFPRKGESVPRLRFKGFHDKWCCIKLGNIGKIKSGTGFPNNEQGGQKGIPFFKVSDMNLSKNNILMNVSSNYVTQNQIDNRHWKPIKPTNGAIIFAKVGAALMKNRKRLINKPFLIDNNLMSYSFNNRWNKHFGLNYFINIYLPKFAQTGALPSFNATSISTIRILLPSLKEQDKIGRFFNNISSLINLQHNKLTCLRKLKKAYLQKMFC